MRRSFNDESYTIRFTPRRPTSIFSTINVAKVARLKKLGKMRPAGLRAFARRTEAKTGVYSFERTAIHWVISAQRPETRAPPATAHQRLRSFSVDRPARPARREKRG